MPEWTRRLTRELDTFAEQNATTTLPVPIALNQPPEPLRLGPSDDAEWAAFTAESLLRAADGTLDPGLPPDRRVRAALDLAWSTLAAEVARRRGPRPRGRVRRTPPARPHLRPRGLGNLAAGLRRPPPATTTRTSSTTPPAYAPACSPWSTPATPKQAAALAEVDARYTQDGDGIHGARAMAAAIAVALGAADVEQAVDAALAQLPEHTEIGRNARHAVKLAQAAACAFDLVPLLEHQIVDHVYSYGIAAAETVPVALALATAARGRVCEAVPAAACLSRVADSAPALAGALPRVRRRRRRSPRRGAMPAGRCPAARSPASPAPTWRNSPDTWHTGNLPLQVDNSDMKPMQPTQPTQLTQRTRPTSSAIGLADRIAGSLVGAAVGDALGGPVEGYAPEQIAERHGGRVRGIVGPWNGDEWRTARPIAPYHKGDGHVADDTLLTHALVRVYGTVRDHLDAYAIADHLVPDLMTTPRWIPELEAEALPLHRLFLAEKWLVARLHYGHVDPREAGTGNIVNCGAAMYMAPSASSTPPNPEGAYAEALDIEGAISPRTAARPRASSRRRWQPPARPAPRRNRWSRHASPWRRTARARRSRR